MPAASGAASPAAGRSPVDVEQEQAHPQPGEIAQEREIDGLHHDDPEQPPIGVTHRLERGELAEPVADVGEEDLVADHQPTMNPITTPI